MLCVFLCGSAPRSTLGSSRFVPHCTAQHCTALRRRTALLASFLIALRCTPRHYSSRSFFVITLVSSAAVSVVVRSGGANVKKGTARVSGWIVLSTAGMSFINRFVYLYSLVFFLLWLCMAQLCTAFSFHSSLHGAALHCSLFRYYLHGVAHSAILVLFLTARRSTDRPSSFVPVLVSVVVRCGGTNVQKGTACLVFSFRRSAWCSTERLVSFQRCTALFVRSW